MSKVIYNSHRDNALIRFLLFSFCFSLSGFLSIQTVNAQLSGTYTIGGNGGDFPSFEPAIQALENQGVSGPVTFKVLPNKFYEQLKLGEIPGVSSQNTVVFESSTGDSTDVVVWYEDDYPLHIDGAVGVTIRSITFERNSGDVAFLDAGSTYNGCCITLENNVFKGGDSGVLLTAFSGVTHHNSNDAHKYLNNLFIGGEIGIRKVRDKHIYQRRPGESIYDRYTTITGNTFTDQKQGIISLYAQEEVTISGNTFLKENEDVWISKEEETAAVTIEGNTILPGSLFEPMQGGTFTIGEANSDFSSFNEAIRMFEFRGSAGPLTFKIRPGTYNEQLHLDKVDSVTFEGETGDSTAVVLQYDGDYVVMIDGVLSHTFRHMTISGTGTAVHINSVTRKTSNILLEHNILKGGGDGAVIYATVEGRTNGNDRHTYRNNRIIGEGSGIVKVRDSHEDPHMGGRSTDGILDISGNTISARDVGIALYAQSGIKINNNIIEVEVGPEQSHPRGISLTEAYMVEEMNNNRLTVRGEEAMGIRMYGPNLPTNILRNHISLPDGGTGMSFDSNPLPGWGDNSLVANNIISVKGSNGSTGIAVKSRETPGLHFNSVLIYGEDKNSKAFSLPEDAYGYYPALSNNIFANTAGGYALYFGAIDNDAVYNIMPRSDYNALYSTGEVLAHWKGTDAADLNEWQSWTESDENSIFADPGFESEEELIPTKPELNNSGLAMEEVSEDFFGKLRNDPPDIGAVEFSARPSGPLSGTYTIGGEDGDFNSFNDAIQTMEANGKSGELIFMVRPGTYNEQLQLDSLGGVVFQGASGDSTDVVLEYEGDYVVLIENKSGFTFRHMTISGSGQVFRIRGIAEPASSITLESNILKGGGTVINAYSVGRGIYSRNHTYRNNLIIGEGTGISKSRDTHVNWFTGGRLTDDGLDISGNIIQVKGTAIDLYAQENVVINNNQISINPDSGRSLTQGVNLNFVYAVTELNNNHITVKGADAEGIMIYGENLPRQIQKNRIILPEGGTGLDIGYTNMGWFSDMLVSNNMISVKGNDGSTGIRMSSSGEAKFYYNSVLIYGEDPTSMALNLPSVGGTDEVHLLNNIFANKAGGYAIYVEHWEDEAEFNPIVSSDYNAFYSSGETLAHWKGREARELSHWQNMTGFDAHSLSVDPQFQSEEELIPANLQLAGAGLSVTEVVSDINGNERKDPPTIGAVELEEEDEEPAVVVSAGRDRTLSLPVNSLILSGTGQVVDGRFTAFRWEKVSGPAVSMSGQQTANLRLTDLEVGEYVFRFTATDNQGRTGSDEVKITIEQGNNIPVVNAGRDKTVTLPTDPVLLSGIAQANGGRFVAFRWEKITGPSVTMEGERTANVRLSDLQEGEYVFRFSATDDRGVTGSDEMTLRVERSNQPPVVSAGGDVTISHFGQYYIKATGYDPDGRFTAFRWEKVSGPAVTMDGQNTANLRITHYEEGEYVFRFSGTDNEGATSTDEMTLRVESSADAGTLASTTVSAYPNTFQSHINVEIQAEVAEEYQIQVFDMLGKTYYKSSFVPDSYNGATHTIDFTGQNMREGTYLIRIENNDGSFRELLKVVNVH